MIPRRYEASFEVEGGLDVAPHIPFRAVGVPFDGAILTRRRSRTAVLLAANPRTAPMGRNVFRVPAPERVAIRIRVEEILANPESLCVSLSTRAYRDAVAHNSSERCQ